MGLTFCRHFRWLDDLECFEYNITFFFIKKSQLSSLVFSFSFLFFSFFSLFFPRTIFSLLFLEFPPFSPHKFLALFLLPIFLSLKHSSSITSSFSKKQDKTLLFLFSFFPWAHPFLLWFLPQKSTLHVQNQRSNSVGSKLKCQALMTLNASFKWLM